MSKNYDEMITAYLENELSINEKIKFEKYANDNLEFSKKVESIRQIVNKLNKKKKMLTSESFVKNLHEKLPEYIDEKESVFNFWFSKNFGSSIVFSLSIICISLFFMDRILNQKEDFNYSNINDEIEENVVLNDSLKIYDNDFPILQVKSSSEKK